MNGTHFLLKCVFAFIMSLESGGAGRDSAGESPALSTGSTGASKERRWGRWNIQLNR